MTAINAALRAGLDTVFARFGENGVVDIGLQSALDVGVKACNYVQVPRSCLKAITAAHNKTITLVANGASGVRVGRCTPVIIKQDWGGYEYEGGDLTDVEQAALTSDELGLLAIANYRGAVAAGWEDR